MNPYGFDWGPVSVERTAHLEGRGYVLTIRTPYRTMQVYASEGGRSLKSCPVRKTPAVSRNDSHG